MTLGHSFFKRSVAEQFMLLQVFSAHAEKTPPPSSTSHLPIYNFSSLLDLRPIQEYEGFSAYRLLEWQLRKKYSGRSLYCTRHGGLLRPSNYQAQPRSLDIGNVDLGQMISTSASVRVPNARI